MTHGVPARLARPQDPLIGRAAELDALEQVLDELERGPPAAIELVGEPGIGKTRLLVAAAELATAEGFTALAATADEEIRGPFLLARGIFATSATENGSNGARDQFQRVLDAMSGQDDPTLDALAPGQWREVTCERGGRIAGSLRFVERRDGNALICEMPQITRFLGPVVAPQTTTRPPGRAESSVRFQVASPTVSTTTSTPLPVASLTAATTSPSS